MCLITAIIDIRTQYQIVQAVTIDVPGIRYGIPCPAVFGFSYELIICQRKINRPTRPKAAGKDEEAGKATFVSLLGIERAQTQARMLADQASAHLEPFGDRVGVLRDAAKFVIERRS